MAYNISFFRQDIGEQKLFFIDQRYDGQFVEPLVSLSAS